MTESLLEVGTVFCYKFAEGSYRVEALDCILNPEIK